MHKEPWLCRATTRHAEEAGEAGKTTAAESHGQGTGGSGGGHGYAKPQLGRLGRLWLHRAVAGQAGRAPATAAQSHGWPGRGVSADIGSSLRPASQIPFLMSYSSWFHPEPLVPLAPPGPQSFPVQSFSV
jgi:hypothetical protein